MIYVLIGVIAAASTIKYLCLTYQAIRGASHDDGQDKHTANDS